MRHLIALKNSETAIKGLDEKWLTASWIGAAFGGSGFGFIRRTVPAHRPAHPTPQRASVFSGVYTADYPAFSIPVIIAGQLAPLAGLITPLQFYAITIMAFAGPSILVQAQQRRKDTIRLQTSSHT